MLKLEKGNTFIFRTGQRTSVHLVNHNAFAVLTLNNAAVFMQKISHFSCKIDYCLYLEDLAKPGVEVVCVGRHSSFQIWRLEGDVLEGQGRRDCVENLEKLKLEKFVLSWKSNDDDAGNSFITCSGLILPASKEATCDCKMNLDDLSQSAVAFIFV